MHQSLELIPGIKSSESSEHYTALLTYLLRHMRKQSQIYNDMAAMITNKQGTWVRLKQVVHQA